MDFDIGCVRWAYAYDVGNDFNFQVLFYDDDDKILFFFLGYIGGSWVIWLVLDGDVVYIEELWYDLWFRFIFLNLLRIGDFVYGTSGQSVMVILTAIYVVFGEIVWWACGFSCASMFFVDGKVILMEEDGDLLFVWLVLDGFEIFVTILLFDMIVWMVLMLVGTMFYVRDWERIVVLELGVR